MKQLIKNLTNLVQQTVQNWNEPTAQPPQPIEASVGRFVFELTDERKEDWEKALDAFDDKKPVEAYNALFSYISDANVKNVYSRPLSTDESAGFEFKILQGSKNIIGHATATEFVAETKVAKANELNVGFMRRLMENNYHLNYSRYALDDENNIILKFHTSASDGSPYKIFHALREIALHADKQDDLLVDEFSAFLTLKDVGSKREISEKERLTKYIFLRKKIESVFEEIKSGKLDAEKYPRGAAFMMLDVAYKLDHLTRPEGLVMEILERIHKIGSERDGKTLQQKNQAIRKDFQKILDRSQAQMESELYHTIETFSLVSESTHSVFINIIDHYISDIEWFIERKYDAAALGLIGFLVGSNLFANGFPTPVRDLLSFYYRIGEPQFFEDLGGSPQYSDPKTGELHAKRIKAAIKGIAEQHQEKFPDVRPDLSELDFDSPVKFGLSYLKMIRNLDL